MDERVNDDGIAERVQSLAEFCASAAETVERVNQNGEPEMITVDGEIRCVVMPPSFYRLMAREFWLARDVAAIERSMAEHDAGLSRPAHEVFNELRTKLIQMKAAQEQARGERA